MTSGNEQPDGRTRVFRFLLGAAAFVIIVAGLRVASTILVPFFLAIFIAVIVSPLFFFLQKLRVPRVLAVLVVVLLVAAVGFGLAQLVGASIDDFTDELPQYQKLLKGKARELIQWAGVRGIQVPEDTVLETLNPGAAMKLVGGMLSGLTGVLTNAFLILITVIFILLEASSFPAKLRATLDDPDASMGYFRKFMTDVQHYMAIKSGMSLATGICVAIWLFVTGVSYPLLFGLFAFLLNYVPNIGSIVAAVPAVLIALIQFGAGKAALVAVGYVGINVGISNFIEPRVMGRGLGLSTLVVFLSLVFWGWVLGVVGMLLAVPLTMTLKIALDSNESTRPVAVILGPENMALEQKKQREEEKVCEDNEPSENE